MFPVYKSDPLNFLLECELNKLITKSIGFRITPKTKNSFLGIIENIQENLSSIRYRGRCLSKRDSTKAISQSARKEVSIAVEAVFKFATKINLRSKLISMAKSLKARQPNDYSNNV
jgi:hypothetical protein